MASSDALRFSVGPFIVNGLTATEPREPPTPANADVPGRAELYEAANGAGTTVALSYVTWANGERHVDMSLKHGGPAKLNSLESRHRLTIQRQTTFAFCELQQARLEIHGSRMRVVRRKATEAELDEGARVHVAGVLKQLGALAVSTREEVFDDTSRNRSYLCVAFDPDDRKVPLGAFILTRVLPPLNGMTA